MNERVMQFRIGMFVIFAGLVLTMMIIWFGESPSLFRSDVYVTVHFAEAPGVGEGIPVRKSGIRVGEVASIRFDDRPRVSGRVIAVDEVAGVSVDLGDKKTGVVPADQFPHGMPAAGTNIDVLINSVDSARGVTNLSLPDGVLVTLTLERKYKLKAGSTPRVSRALIGDVSIDMLPGTGQGMMATSDTPRQAPIIEGSVAPDPSGALAAATKAFEKVGGTLDSIKTAADGVSSLAKKADGLDDFLGNAGGMSKKIGTLAAHLDDVVQENRADVRPAIAGLRQAVDKVNSTLDPPTQARFKEAIAQISSGSAKLDRILADFAPLARDLGSPANTTPTTSVGQAVTRLNRVVFELSLLSGALVDPTDPKGRRLNTNGSLQKMLISSELHDNLNGFASSGRDVFSQAGRMIRNLTEFSEKIARDPAIISSGALRPR